MYSFEEKWVEQVFWAEQKDLGRSTMATNEPHNVNQYYVMNHSINSFTGASEAPAYGGYVKKLIISGQNNK